MLMSVGGSLRVDSRIGPFVVAHEGPCVRPDVVRRFRPVHYGNFQPTTGFLSYLWGPTFP